MTTKTGDRHLALEDEQRDLYLLFDECRCPICHQRRELAFGDPILLEALIFLDVHCNHCGRDFSVSFIAARIQTEMEEE